jgi:hypothetical protein
MQAAERRKTSAKKKPDAREVCEHLGWLLYAQIETQRKDKAVEVRNGGVVADAVNE